MRYDLVNSTKQVDLSTLTWTISGSEFLYTTPASWKRPDNSNVQGMIWQDLYPNKAGNRRHDSYPSIALTAGGYLYINDKFVSTVAELKAKLSGHMITYVSTDAPRRFDMVNQQGTISGSNISDSNLSWPSRSFYISRSILNPPSKKQQINLIFDDPDGVIQLSPHPYQDPHGNIILYTKASYNDLTEVRTACVNVKFIYVAEKPKRFNFVNDTKQVDLGSSDWFTYNAQYNSFYINPIADMAFYGYLNFDGYTKESSLWYFTHEESQVRDKIYYINTSNGYLYVKDKRFNTAAEFKAAMSGHILTYQSTQKETL